MEDPSVSSSDDSLPTAAIAIIACSCWIGVIIVLLLIRQCCKDRGLLPNCDCGQCQCCEDTGEPSCLSACLRSLGETCDCTAPSTRAWCDSVCPSRESCHQCCDSCTSCFACLQAEGDCCQGDCCQGEQCDCGQCCTCPECPDCTCPSIECPNCACECQTPQCDVIYCFCCQITLSGAQGRPR
ncbi:uncharacterized protein LOC134194157 [Corticium candelabrum]|uniref:uncharacterized protein LOC134194157 n=1 Tax=Corticium candelabrum TaxID=121492 RepID=UPI002E25E55E|nr:uncharacterized protein LOC134194157 [Corticium candelabrum]